MKNGKLEIERNEEEYEQTRRMVDRKKRADQGKKLKGKNRREAWQ
jgi:hypothetical protein